MRPLILYFLFLVAFSLMLVECDRIFPSNDKAPNQVEPGAINIKNIILEVPANPPSIVVGTTCENNIKKGKTPNYKNLFSTEKYLTVKNYDALDNYYNNLFYSDLYHAN